VTYAEWQSERRSGLMSPTGNLALVAYQPVTGREPEPILELPASVSLPEAGEGVLITAAAGSGVSAGGRIIDGTVFVNRLQPDGTPIVRWGRYSLDVFSLDGTDYELRIYDSRAPNLAGFDHVEYYAEDPQLVVRGSYHAYPELKQVPWDFTRASDSGHTKHVPGIIDVVIEGRQYPLLAFHDGAMLVLVFSDGTTGAESYAPGRFLRLAAPGSTSAVTLDFNRAFIPPCGFSDYYSCPIPPAQNRIAAPIRGGEKRVRWRGGGSHG
jgi:uncharacterized protein